MKLEKKEFIDTFEESPSTKERNLKAKRMTLGNIRFDYERDISVKDDDKECSIDYCEMCYHPRGATVNTFEICTTFDGIDIPKLIENLREKTAIYFAQEKKVGNLKVISDNAEGQCGCVPNIVIPPNPKMIMELGEHIEEILEQGELSITIYDPKTDKRGAIAMDPDFFAALKEDDDYEGMTDAEVFTNYMMNFADLL